MRNSPILPLLFALLLLVVAACGGEESASPDPDAGSTDVQVKDSPGGKDVIVTDKVAGNNEPPVLYKIGDKVVAQGATLSLTLRAEDPDGDLLRFSVYGDVPRSAKFLKDKGEFSWTPEAADVGSHVFLTFVVSDGQDFDRETVEIAVTAEAGQNAPVFQKLGDQSVEAGKSYEWQLVATDADSDVLSYSIQGAVPPGLLLDGVSALVRWTVPAGSEGELFRVVFVVSDGQLQGQQEVTFVVGGGATATNHAPVFETLPEQLAVAGETLSFTILANDEDGDSLSYAVVDGLPPGATFDAPARRFSWTTGAADAGKSRTVTFSVSDASLQAYLEVQLTVQKPVSACTPDAYEPNGDPAEGVSPLQDGDVLELSLCPQGGLFDADWFAVTLPAGARLTVASRTLDPQSQVNIDLEISLPSAPYAPLSYGWSDGPEESVSFVAQEAGPLLLLVYQYGGDPLSESVAYELRVEIEAEYSCSEDAFEENDSLATPYLMSSATLGKDLDSLRYCPGDADYFAVDLACGESLSAAIFFSHAAGDLDLLFYGPGAAAGSEPLAASISEDDDEIVVLDSAPQSGRYTLFVEGYPAEGTENAYTLRVDTSPAPACDADALEPNDTTGQATPLGEAASYEDLTLCCDPDIYRADLDAGDGLLVEATSAYGTPMPLALYASDGQTLLASASGDLDFLASSAGSVYLVIKATPGVATGQSYTLETIVGGGGDCDAASCPMWTVCNASTGACVADYCSSDGDCPAPYECQQSFCVDACASGDDCRGGYGCKAFAAGTYCAPAGNGAPGSGCVYVSDCEGAMVCELLSDGGYCATANCPSFPCDGQTLCVDVGGASICAKSCAADGDCRPGEGFFCAETGAGKACVPFVD